MYFISNYCLPDFKLVACVVASSSCVLLYSAHTPTSCPETVHLMYRHSRTFIVTVHALSLYGYHDIMHEVYPANALKDDKIN
jgi:hypothetical protein